MKKIHLVLILLGLFLFASCTVTTIPSNSQIDIGWDGSYYDYDRINILYRNYPLYFNTYTYIDQYGYNVPYTHHPYFIRYRSESTRRNNYINRTQIIRSNTNRPRTDYRNNTSIRKNTTQQRNSNYQIQRTQTRTTNPVQRRTPAGSNRTNK